MYIIKMHAIYLIFLMNLVWCEFQLHCKKINRHISRANRGWKAAR